VASALDEVRQRGAAESPVPAVTLAPARGDAIEALPTVVAVAVGIVMHRFSLARGPALVRLQQCSVQEGRSLVQTCTAMVEALEQLALPGVP
jgi:response regulator NasT